MDMTITLNYVTVDGEEKQADYATECEQIELNGKDCHIARIDLSPLSSCTNLREFHLWWNQLQFIDLTPLGFCSSLETLRLSQNQLKTIDLTPLSSCSNLQHFELYFNELQSIDLEPLSSCHKLEFLALGANKLETIDLSPLESCTKLLRLDLNSNQIHTLDASPLSSSPSLGQFSTKYTYCSLQVSNNNLDMLDLTAFIVGSEGSIYNKTGQGTHGFSWIEPHEDNAFIPYGPPSHANSWNFYQKVYSKYGSDRRVQQDILFALGFKSFGFIEGDLSDIILPLTSSKRPNSMDDIREQIGKRVVERVAETIDNGGATTGLDLEELVDHGEIAKRAKRIGVLREREIERVMITQEERSHYNRYFEVFDLRELWRTAYGYEILNALDLENKYEHTIYGDEIPELGKEFNFRRYTLSAGIDHIKNAFTELGFDLKVGDSSVSGVNMTEDLKERISWITENRGKYWRDIQ